MAGQHRPFVMVTVRLAQSAIAHSKGGASDYLRKASPPAGVPLEIDAADAGGGGLAAQPQEGRAAGALLLWGPLAHQLIQQQPLHGQMYLCLGLQHLCSASSACQPLSQGRTTLFSSCQNVLQLMQHNRCTSTPWLSILTKVFPPSSPHPLVEDAQQLVQCERAVYLCRALRRQDQHVHVARLRLPPDVAARTTHVKCHDHAKQAFYPSGPPPTCAGPT